MSGTTAQTFTTSTAFQTFSFNSNSVCDGTLIFTDIGDQVLRAARFNSAGEVISVDTVSQNLGFIVDMETEPGGFLYYVDITGSVGHRLVERFKNHYLRKQNLGSS